MPKETVEIDLGDARGVCLTADRWPGDLEPVVLQHGGGQTRHSWGETAEAIAATGHEVYSVDLRGHGDSTWAADGAYAFSDYALDLNELLARFDQPAVVVGASLGGMAGMITAGHHQHLVKALVLVDITARPATDGVDRVLSFMAQTAETGFATLEEAGDAVAAYQPGRTRPKNLDGLKKNLRLGDDGRWRWHWDPAFMTHRNQASRGRNDFHLELEHAARALTCPTFLIRGRKSDLVTDAEVADFLQLVPHAQYVDVADAAHMVAGDVNDVFTASVLEFLATLH